jgi:hypothetical protein
MLLGLLQRLEACTCLLTLRTGGNLTIRSSANLLVTLAGLGLKVLVINVKMRVFTFSDALFADRGTADGNSLTFDLPDFLLAERLADRS